MSIGRRRFLKAGALAACFAAVPLKSVWGQSWKDRDGNPDQSSNFSSDPLANYTKATFNQYLNSVFELHTVAGVVAVTLLRVDDMPAAKGGECFSLLFRGGSRAFKQDTYTLGHPALGSFQLLLVPVGTDQNGAQGYLATINRLSFKDALTLAPPKPSGSLRTTATQTSAPTSATAPTSSTTPTNTSPTTTSSPPVIVVPSENKKPPKRKPRRRKSIAKVFKLD